MNFTNQAWTVSFFSELELSHYRTDTPNLPDSLGRVRIGTSPPFPFLDQLVPGPELSVLGYHRVFYGGLS